MSDSRELFVEGKIIGAVQRLLAGRVNELLSAYDLALPAIEFGNYTVGNVVVPVITLVHCECSEKERLILVDAYSVTIRFSLAETPEADVYCYAYAAAVEKSMREDRTLGGCVDRIILTGKKYVFPHKPYCGDRYELVLSYRLTVERYT